MGCLPSGMTYNYYDSTTFIQTHLPTLQGAILWVLVRYNRATCQQTDDLSEGDCIVLSSSYNRTATTTLIALRVIRRQTTTPYRTLLIVLYHVVNPCMGYRSKPI